MFKPVMLRPPPAGWWLKLDFIVIGVGFFFLQDFSFAKKYKPTVT